MEVSKQKAKLVLARFLSNETGANIQVKHVRKTRYCFRFDDPAAQSVLLNYLKPLCYAIKSECKLNGSIIVASFKKMVCQ